MAEPDRSFATSLTNIARESPTLVELPLSKQVEMESLRQLECYGFIGVWFKPQGLTNRDEHKIERIQSRESLRANKAICWRSSMPEAHGPTNKLMEVVNQC